VAELAAKIQRAARSPRKRVDWITKQVAEWQQRARGGK
jgi:hypothetical protein